VVQVSSLAKGFGAPVAVLAGPAWLVERVTAGGPTRVHSSPPSMADLRAAERALAVNDRDGPGLRARLVALVRRFHTRLAAGGVRVPAGLFPIQRFPAEDRSRALHLHDTLLRAGVRTVVSASGHGGGPSLTLILTAARTPAEVDRAGDLLVAALGATAPTATGAIR
jgi:8-amino-7-oxononanoate synthase